MADKSYEYKYSHNGDHSSVSETIRNDRPVFTDITRMMPTT